MGLLGRARDVVLGESEGRGSWGARGVRFVGRGSAPPRATGSGLRCKLPSGIRGKVAASQSFWGILLLGEH